MDLGKKASETSPEIAREGSDLHNTVCLGFTLGDVNL